TETFSELIERAQLPRNMIENSMFEEEPDVVDLAKEPRLHPLEPDEVEYEPHSSRLLVRGLGEHDLEDDEEDYESSARLLGMSFMNRSSNHRNNLAGGYNRETSGGSCSTSARTIIVGAFVFVIILSVAMVAYFLPKCTFTKEGCHKKNTTLTPIFPMTADGKVFPWAKMRLPNAVVPVRYVLVLHPNLTTLTFTGSVEIHLEVKENTDSIILHSSGLHYTEATLAPEVGGQPMAVKVLEYIPRAQIAIKVTPNLLKGQKYNLNLNYAANLSNTYYGFYNSSYKDKDQNKRLLAATQFEPFAARTAFPCFDEPAFKATFRIKIIREQSQVALSNMQKNATVEKNGGLFEDEFCESVKMSTYLVAFIVAELTHVTSSSKSGTVVSVHAVPHKMEQIHYALEAAVKLLDFYESYFNISYPLKKLDLVGIPDFQAGAMENWGLITFRESLLLYSYNYSSIMDKQMITMVIAHELAHQWFGNLVTMEWWNDLWLNEGFATFMEFLSLEKIYPELQVADRFLQRRFLAMDKDSLNSSHPLSTPVETAEQIEEMFDTVSYDKGASILLMLKDFLSEDTFQQGIMRYLMDHKFGSAKNEDLWNSIAKVNHDLDVKEMMKTWTLQTGFPLVTVKLDKAAKKIYISQERFLKTVMPQDPASSTNSSSLWHIPLTNDAREFHKNFDVFYLPSGTIDFTEPDVTWVKFNLNTSGYYVVYYENCSEELIQLLQKNHTVLSDHDRASLINNAFGLVSLGRIPLGEALHLTKYLKNEVCTAPVTEALGQFNYIYNLVQRRGLLDLAGRMKVFKNVFDLFGKLIDKQTWSDNGSFSERQLRSTLLSAACNYDYNECIQNATLLFNNWTKFTNSTCLFLPTDLISTVFMIGSRTSEGWDFSLKVYTHLQLDSEKHKILMALANTENVKQLVWLLQNSLSNNIIKAHELPYILDIASKNVVGYLHTWDFVKEKWDPLVKKFHLGSSALQKIITETTQFSTKMHLLEVQTFFDSLKDQGSQLQSVQESLELIHLNIQWMDRNLNNLKTWL
uniref:Leucyl/cystinyl aminopeptidase n=2 Tax=Callorhinchus milii TaxID=7868 RepID=A0A4W3KBD6_CALMI